MLDFIDQYWTHVVLGVKDFKLLVTKRVLRRENRRILYVYILCYFRPQYYCYAQLKYRHLWKCSYCLRTLKLTGKVSYDDRGWRIRLCKLEPLHTKVFPFRDVSRKVFVRRAH